MTQRQPEPSLTERPLLHDHPTALWAAVSFLGVGLALFLAMAIPSLADLVQVVDDAVWELAVDLESSFVVAVAEAFDTLGSAWVTTSVMVIVGVFLIVVRRWRGLAYWAVTMVASQLLIGPVKNLYERERPPLPLVETSSFSFPSGHAVAGAAIAVALVIVLVPAGPKRRNLEVVAFSFALLMALSRVYLRAHWLSDVVAGVALGAGVAVGVAVVFHMREDRRTLGAARGS